MAQIAEHPTVHGVCREHGCGYIYTEPLRMVKTGKTRHWPECPRCGSKAKPMTVEEAARLRRKHHKADLKKAIRMTETILNMETKILKARKEELDETSSRETFWHSVKREFDAQDSRCQMIENLRVELIDQHRRAGGMS